MVEPSQAIFFRRRSPFRRAFPVVSGRSGAPGGNTRAGSAARSGNAGLRSRDAGSLRRRTRAHTIVDGAAALEREGRGDGGGKHAAPPAIACARSAAASKCNAKMAASSTSTSSRALDFMSDTLLRLMAGHPSVDRARDDAARIPRRPRRRVRVPAGLGRISRRHPRCARCHAGSGADRPSRRRRSRDAAGTSARALGPANLRDGDRACLRCRRA